MNIWHHYLSINIFLYYVFEIWCLFYTKAYLNSYQSHFKFSLATCGYQFESTNTQFFAEILSTEEQRSKT